MKTKSVKKTFDCIKFKHKIQGEIYQEIKKMDGKEQIEYFKHSAESGYFRHWWKRNTK